MEVNDRIFSMFSYIVVVYHSQIAQKAEFAKYRSPTTIVPLCQNLPFNLDGDNSTCQLKRRQTSPFSEDVPSTKVIFSAFSAMRVFIDHSARF
jgi:hypothetical protein